MSIQPVLALLCWTYQADAMIRHSAAAIVNAQSVSSIRLNGLAHKRTNGCTNPSDQTVQSKITLHRHKANAILTGSTTGW